MRGIIEIQPSSTGYVEAFHRPDELAKAGDTLLHAPPELWAVTVDGFDRDYLEHAIAG